MGNLKRRGYPMMLSKNSQRDKSYLPENVKSDVMRRIVNGLMTIKYQKDVAFVGINLTLLH